LYTHPDIDFEQMLAKIHYKPMKKEEILKQLPRLHRKFEQVRHSASANGRTDWIMGQLHHNAIGNIPLSDLRQEIEQMKVNP
jgi:glutamyl-tRNA(Gln) amidotransferase subunit E